MHLMLQNSQPSDFVIASELHHHFVNLLKMCLTSTVRRLCCTSDKFKRPSDLNYSALDPSFKLNSDGQIGGVSEIASRLCEDRRIDDFNLLPHQDSPDRYHWARWQRQAELLEKGYGARAQTPGQQFQHHPNWITSTRIRMKAILALCSTTVILPIAPT